MFTYTCLQIRQGSSRLRWRRCAAKGADRNFGHVCSLFSVHVCLLIKAERAHGYCIVGYALHAPEADVIDDKACMRDGVYRGPE